MYNSNIQHIYTDSYRAMAKQGWVKSMASDGPDQAQCKYRGPDGIGCAIGVLLPLDMEVLEGEAIHILIKNKQSVASFFGDTPEVVHFLRDLQDCHDKSDGPVDMRTRYERLALSI